MLLKRLLFSFFLIFAINCDSEDGTHPYHVLIDKSRIIRYSQTGYDQGALESLIQTTLNE